MEAKQLTYPERARLEENVKKTSKSVAIKDFIDQKEYFPAATRAFQLEYIADKLLESRGYNEFGVKPEKIHPGSNHAYSNSTFPRAKGWKEYNQARRELILENSDESELAQICISAVEEN